MLKYTNASLEVNRDRYLGSLAPPPYGAGAFGQAGARAHLLHDTRDNPAYPTRGFLVDGAGEAYAAAWNVTSAFGSLAGEGRAPDPGIGLAYTREIPPRAAARGG